MIYKKMNSFFFAFLISTIAIVSFSGCTTIYYNAWEKLGKEKRDILRDRIKDAESEQKEASKQFKDALTHIRALYGSNGSDLEKTYDKVSSDYDNSKDKAEALKNRIAKVEEVAGDLFDEWEKEIKEMSNDNLRDDSRHKLKQTKAHYAEMHTAMKKAESSMAPVLTAFRDQVLYLKHNLNAQAVGTLGKEYKSIEKDINELVERMDESMRKSSEFTSNLHNS